MKNYQLGAQRNPLDLRRIKLAQVQSPVEIPKQYFTDLSFIPCFDQKQLGACVGHAHATVHIYQNHKETGQMAKLSPRYLYALAKKVDGIPTQQGTFPAVVAKISKDKGCASENVVLNDTKLSHVAYINIEETEEMKANAYPFRSGGYAEVGTDKESIKQAIFQNNVILGTISVGNYTSPIKKGDQGLHRIVFCGYGYKGIEFKDGKIVPFGIKSNRIFFYNSWSDQWGEKGFGYFDLEDQKLYDLEAQIDIPNELLEKARALPTLRLTRYNSDKFQTLGEAVASMNGKTFSFKTLEKPWLNNKMNVSCIKTGSYVCKWEYSKKYKTNIARLYNVEGRTGILIHVGNYFKDIAGCIIVGDKHSDINKDGEKDVTNSRVTLDKLFAFFGGKEFTLIIK